MGGNLKKLKVLVSGGGTGGHIFPAIAIANAIKEIRPDTEFLFVGAEGKMEMEKVPAAGFDIEGLWISGFNRSWNVSNLMFPFKLISSILRAGKIVKRFQPDVAIGTGGFASGPTLRVASQKGVPCLIQEQNSFPGVTNRILSGKAKRICVAYEGMDKFFPAEKVVLTGNPVRKEVVQIEGKRDEAIQFFDLDASKKTLLIVGGSLGAQSVNYAILANLQRLVDLGIQILWQTGKTSYKDINTAAQPFENKGVHVLEFIFKMDLGYAAADMVISRAGAIAVSELELVGKPTVLVPFPYAAEDHQTKNAMSLVAKGAALLVKDADVNPGLLKAVEQLVTKEAVGKSLTENIKKMGMPNAANQIAKEVLRLIK
ncbi:MAG: UDP-N-acetylglucosamine--N-acetylmuramyl-(pentapeptide) pyrophosphoryl-undecaprenol N-acetylglucosamine transferase [Salibacteraceae bacterium]|jgi:UDP-N-acetylglucosamine--N-acetylmuramyl-(pentapeptide) pyrophosphoryl-undecaprenol N-acetylglucosamine transferase